MSPTCNMHFTVVGMMAWHVQHSGGLGKVWREESISIRAKTKLYYAMVVPVVLCDLECLCLRKKDDRILLVAEVSWLMGIIGRNRR